MDEKLEQISNNKRIMWKQSMHFINVWEHSMNKYLHVEHKIAVANVITAKVRHRSFTFSIGYELESEWMNERMPIDLNAGFL